MSDQLRVLFLCVHNSARSQLAEGILRALAGERVLVFSAGSAPSRVHPLALRVLEERGIDASAQRSKGVNEFASDTFDYVITLCAEEVCPIFLGATQKLHWALPDPSADPEPLNAFRRTADELEQRLRQFLAERNVQCTSS
ncbi:MAG: arsenate reductase ArsC [Chloroflexi bacterium]|nr:arsenate reductase ArsC [Chloroflexota bacterium]